MRLAVHHHPAFLQHVPPTAHVERPPRYAAIVDALRASALPIAWHEAAPALPEEVLRVHTLQHMQHVEAACAASEWLDADTYTTPASHDAALRAAGAALAAAHDAAQGQPAFALVRPPGHHATPTRAMGFCLYNNVAIAAAMLAQEGRRVAIVDIDVHHGNGTQDAFWTRQDILYASLHQSPLYPGTGHLEEAGADAGLGTTLNLPLPAGTGDTGWLETLDGAVLPALRAFRPDVLLVSAGYDADHRDPLGGLRLTPGGYHAAITRLRDACPRIAAILEGGYSLEALRDDAHATAQALLGHAGPEPTPDTGPRPWAHLRKHLPAAHEHLA